MRERSEVRKRHRENAVWRGRQRWVWSIYRPREARIAGQYQTFGQTWDRCFFSELPEGTNPANILISDLCPPEP